MDSEQSSVVGWVLLGSRFPVAPVAKGAASDDGAMNVAHAKAFLAFVAQAGAVLATDAGGQDVSREGTILLLERPASVVVDPVGAVYFDAGIHCFATPDSVDTLPRRSVDRSWPVFHCLRMSHWLLPNLGVVEGRLT